jgi:TolA-binding protein
MLTLSAAPLLAAGGDMETGIAYFSASRFNEALHTFRNIIADPGNDSLHGDAYFWLAKTHLAMNNLDDCEKNLEFFLLTYENNRNFPEALYQKGRLLYLQKEYEKSIQVLYNFIEQFPSNPFCGNAYFWIGESLYDLGHFDKARKVFATVTRDYPKSYKYDAAQYRISLIELKYREQELMKFLKWSHEEALKTLEEFQIREKTYEQAITAYQKKLAEYAEAGTERKIEELTLAVREKEAEIVNLRNQLNNLQGRIESVSGNLEAARLENEELSSKEGGDTTGTQRSVLSDSQFEKKKELLLLKEKALDLKSFYIDWLNENPE